MKRSLVLGMFSGLLAVLAAVSALGQQGATFDANLPTSGGTWTLGLFDVSSSDLFTSPGSSIYVDEVPVSPPTSDTDTNGSVTFTVAEWTGSYYTNILITMPSGWSPLATDPFNPDFIYQVFSVLPGNGQQSAPVQPPVSKSGMPVVHTGTTIRFIEPNRPEMDQAKSGRRGNVVPGVPMPPPLPITPQPPQASAPPTGFAVETGVDIERERTRGPVSNGGAPLPITGLTPPTSLPPGIIAGQTSLISIERAQAKSQVDYQSQPTVESTDETNDVQEEEFSEGADDERPVIAPAQFCPAAP